MANFKIGDKVIVHPLNQQFVDLYKHKDIPISFEGIIVDILPSVPSNDITIPSNILIKADINLHTVSKSRFSSYQSDNTDLLWVSSEHLTYV